MRWTLGYYSLVGHWLHLADWAADQGVSDKDHVLLQGGVGGEVEHQCGVKPDV